MTIVAVIDHGVLAQVLLSLWRYFSFVISTRPDKALSATSKERDCDARFPSPIDMAVTKQLQKEMESYTPVDIIGGRAHESIVVLIPLFPVAVLWK